MATTGRQIVVKGPATGSKSVELLFVCGTFTLVSCPDRRIVSRLLRLLAGMETVRGVEVGIREGESARAGKLLDSEFGTAYLPPPGSELFAGTTVEEEMSFGARADGALADRRRELAGRFGLDLEGLGGRSVWELSESERRCLLLVSQGSFSPVLWVLDQPLAMLDGSRARAVESFLARETERGAAVVAADDGLGGLAAVAGRAMVFGASGAVIYSGDTAGLIEGMEEQGDFYPEIIEALRELKAGTELEHILYIFQKGGERWR